MFGRTTLQVALTPIRYATERNYWYVLARGSMLAITLKG